MKKLYNIPTEEELIRVANILNEEFSEIKKSNMTILFELDSALLRQLDEEYFIKRNKGSEEDTFIPGTEVIVVVNGITFKFIQKNTENVKKEENEKTQKSR